MKGMGQTKIQTDNLQPGELAATPERSVVSLMVVDTVGSTELIADLDPDDAQNLLDRIYHYVREQVEDAGGLLVSFAGDGGVAMFGWPGSQEDHADRACETAWSIQSNISAKLDSPNHEPVKFRIGIHSGLVGIRQLPLEGGTVLDLVGATIHLAAALEKRAPAGGILISTQCVNLCRTQLHLKERENFRALEKSGGRAFLMHDRPTRLSSSDVKDRYKLPIVGREIERGWLADHLPSRRNDNTIIGLIGEPGIGKSRLVTNLIKDAEAEARSIRILVHLCEEKSSAQPFAAISSLIAQALEVPLQAPLDEVQVVMSREGIFLRPELLGMLEGFWQQDAGSNLDRINIASELAEAFLILSVREPLLIILEDLHWTDPESLRCLAALKEFETAYPFSLVVTSREAGAKRVERIADASLELKPLDQLSMEQICQQLVPEGVLTDEARKTMAKRADGVPLFLEQLATNVGGQKLFNPASLPQSVESAVHARLHQLDSDEKALAQIISVFGGSAELGLLAGVLESSSEKLQQGLHALEKLRFIHPPSGNSVQIQHALIADACSTTLGRELRTDIHQKAVQHLETHSIGATPPHGRLAFHHEQSGDDKKALIHLWEEAQIARQSWANGSLLLIFERALACCQRLGSQADEMFMNFVLIAFAPMLQLGEFTAMRPHLPKALKIAEAGNWKDKLCGMLSLKAMICWFDGLYMEGLEASRKAAKLAEELDSVPLEFMSKLQVAGCQHGLARVEEAVETKLQLLKRLEEHLPPEKHTSLLGMAVVPMAMTLGNLCWYLPDIDRANEGEEFGRRALALARSAKDGYTQVLMLLALGRCRLLQNNSKEACELLTEGYTMAMQNGYNPAAAHLAGLLASALARQGNSEEALKVVRELKSAQSGMRAGELELFHLNFGQAEALFVSDKKQSALQAIEHAIGYAVSMTNKTLIIQGVGARGRMRLAQNPDCLNGKKDIEIQATLCDRYGLCPHDHPFQMTA